MNTNPQHEPDLCPNCQHPRHLPGTECQTPVNHGPSRFHLCLCLARPGAALPCPPQMTCQGGALGYADVWYLQQGHTLMSEDGEISPEVLALGVASVGFPSRDDEPAAVPVSSPSAARADDRAGLRDRIAAALDAAFQSFDPDATEDAALAGHLADAVLAVLPPPADRAALLLWAADQIDAETRQAKAHGVLEPDRFRPCRDASAQLRRMADEAQQPETPAVAPPPVLTEEGRLRAQVEVLQQDAERDRGLAKVGARCMREGHQGLIESGRAVIEGWRFALSTALGLGTGAPWEAIHERVKELAAVPAVGAQQQPTLRPDFTSPIAGRVEVRDPCPWCDGTRMIPRAFMDAHIERHHPDVQVLDIAEAQQQPDTETPTPVSPAYARLQAAAKEAAEAAHLHAMHGMKRTFHLARRYGDQPIPASEVLNALGLDENANTIEPAPPAPVPDPTWPRRAWDLGLLHKGGDPHHCPACLKQPEPPANFVCPGDNTEVLANPQPASGPGGVADEEQPKTGEEKRRG